MKKSTRYKIRDARYENASALILAVVLTSLLAIVGVLFVMVSRVDKIATSAISENRELDFAIDAVVARISQELALDVPGMLGEDLNGNGVLDPGEDLNGNGILDLEEYYDYPDVNNAWLASLEPYEHRWHRSNIYGFDLPDFRIDPGPEIIPDYQNPERVGHTRVGDTYPADADGDGVSDSWWVELPHITSGTGSPIYAAVRVIDNSAMLNVNTVYADPGGPDMREGDMLTDIYIDGLVKLGSDQIPNFLANRDDNPIDADTYYLEASRRIDNPDFSQGHIYTPYDISEELSLRNRFILHPDETSTRLEAGSAGDPDSCFSTTLRWTGYGNSYTPYTDSDFDAWKRRFNPFDEDKEPNSNNYDFRHLLTTYNMDRIIAPDGGIMLNVNRNINTTADKYDLRDRITAALLYAGGDVDKAKADGPQIAANIIDYRDTDDIVTDVCDVDGFPYYGFERPCIYISELLHNSVKNLLGDPCDLTTPLFFKSYAIELYKPYAEDSDPCNNPFDWQLVIDNPPRVININWPYRQQFHMIQWLDPNAPWPWDPNTRDPCGVSPAHGAFVPDINDVVLSWPVNPDADSYDVYFGTNYGDVSDANNSLPVDTSVYKGNQDSDSNSYDPNVLTRDATYFWRIDDVNGTDTWTREVWMFRTSSPGIAQTDPSWSPGQEVFNVGSVIRLRRFVPDTAEYITVDSRAVPLWLVIDPDPNVPRLLRSFQRDTTLHKCIRRLWDESGTYQRYWTPWSGSVFVDPDMTMIQAHPENTNFVGIGDIGKVFAVDASLIGPSDAEAAVRIDLANPAFQQLLNYLTVFDPTSDGIDNDGLYGPDDPNELKIPGRININTAPWYVIAQLPWVRPQTAQAIVAYRDKLQLIRGLVDYSKEPTGRGTGMVDVRAALPPAVVREALGFASMAELLNVTHDLADKGSPWYEAPFDIRQYGRDKDTSDIDQPEFPDLTSADGAANDFEERDLIFARISNLVTVRSDVFTAYILVRIGVDGPQKRAVAILDRSNVYYNPGAMQTVGRVRIVALHPVPDPR